VTPCVAFTELAGAGDERQYRREVLDDGSGSALKVACCQESTHLMPRLGVGRMVTRTQHAYVVCLLRLVGGRLHRSLHFGRWRALSRGPASAMLCFHTVTPNAACHQRVLIMAECYSCTGRGLGRRCTTAIPS